MFCGTSGFPGLGWEALLEGLKQNEVVVYRHALLGGIRDRFLTTMLTAICQSSFISQLPAEITACLNAGKYLTTVVICYSQ